MNVLNPKWKAVTEVWKRITSQGASLFLYPTSYFVRDQIKEAVTGGRGVAYREEWKSTEDFDGETRKKQTN